MTVFLRFFGGEANRSTTLTSAAETTAEPTPTPEQIYTELADSARRALRDMLLAHEVPLTAVSLHIHPGEMTGRGELMHMQVVIRQLNPVLTERLETLQKNNCCSGWSKKTRAWQTITKMSSGLCNCATRS